jgi:hypothetical protein
MNLPEYLLPKQRDPEQIRELVTLVREIELLLESKQPATSQIAAFNEATGQSYEPHEFRDIQAATRYETFAAVAAAGRPPKLANITDAEFIEIIRRLCSGQASEVEQNYWIDLLHINLACPNISNFVYWPDREMTPEEILARARKTPVIIIPPPSAS